jgi:glucose/arabinose dehydrogenase
MRRLSALALFAAACTGQEIAPTTAADPIPTTTTTTGATTTTALTETTTTEVDTTTTSTLPPLRGLSYQEVAGADFPIHLVPWTSEGSLLATKDGRLWTFDGQTVSDTPVLDIRDQVADRGEQGMLAVAVHPDDSDRVFVHYSANNGDTVISELAWDAAGLTESRIHLRLGQPAGNHNGGMIQFGPDGRLYLGLGDGGGAGDRFGHGQNTDTLLGGLVAIDVDGGEGEAELFQYGLRNPWRFWIEEDLIYIADVGQSAFEEVSVSVLEPGINYGWPITEGLHCYSPPTDCDTSGITLPVIEVSHQDSGTCSITGGVVYRGAAIAEVDGHYFYSDYCAGYLRSFVYSDGSAVEETDWTDQVGNAGRVVSFGLDHDGEMYVLTVDRVLRVVADRG